MNKKTFILYAVLVFLLAATQSVFAAFSLTATPYEGGFDLRFGKMEPGIDRVNKEVNISITSDLNKQYRLSHTLIEPLRNNQGIALPSEMFVVYGIRGSNKFGTMNIAQEAPVSVGRTILYTSNSQGVSDSFILSYGLKQPLNAAPGSYRGRIVFTLEPLSSGQSPVNVSMNISADFESEANIEISTPKGSKLISLSSQATDPQDSDIIFQIKGNFGRQFRILQLIAQPLESQTGEQLSPDAVYFQVKDITRGSGITQPTPLAVRQEAIYNSDPRGTQDNFTVHFTLAEADKLKAGKYKTRLRYLLEGTAEQKQLGTFDLQVQIERIFDLFITPEVGGSIEFRDVKPNQAPRISSVIVEVKSNIGKQYQISQKVFSDLVNKDGQAIAPKYFTLREEAMDTKGTLKYPQPQEVKAGETVMFVSDRKGSSDKFRLIYELSASRDFKAGDYSTRITYSISEI